jgi:hypothetical protein
MVQLRVISAERIELAVRPNNVGATAVDAIFIPRECIHELV